MSLALKKGPIGNAYQVFRSSLQGNLPQTTWILAWKSCATKSNLAGKCLHIASVYAPCCLLKSIPVPMGTCSLEFVNDLCTWVNAYQSVWDTYPTVTLSSWTILHWKRALAEIFVMVSDCSTCCRERRLVRFERRMAMELVSKYKYFFLIIKGPFCFYRQVGLSDWDLVERQVWSRDWTHMDLSPAVHRNGKEHPAVPQIPCLLGLHSELQPQQGCQSQMQYVQDLCILCLLVTLPPQFPDSPFLGTPVYLTHFLKGECNISVAFNSNSKLPPSLDVGFCNTHCTMCNAVFRVPDHSLIRTPFSTKVRQWGVWV